MRLFLELIAENSAHTAQVVWPKYNIANMLSCDVRILFVDSDQYLAIFVVEVRCQCWQHAFLWNELHKTYALPVQKQSEHSEDVCCIRLGAAAPRHVISSESVSPGVRAEFRQRAEAPTW